MYIASLEVGFVISAQLKKELYTKGLRGGSEADNASIDLRDYKRAAFFLNTCCCWFKGMVSFTSNFYQYYIEVIPAHNF